MKYLRTKPKFFWSESDNGVSVKNRVFLSRLPDEQIGVAIIRRCYTDKTVDGWTPLKTMKGKTLYDNSIHIKLSSLNKVIDIINSFIDENNADDSD